MLLRLDSSTICDFIEVPKSIIASLVLTIATLSADFLTVARVYPKLASSVASSGTVTDSSVNRLKMHAN